MNKGVVMEITEKSIVVMRPDGKFERLPRKKRTCEIGEEIVYANSGINWRSPSVAGRSALAAAVVFGLVLFASFNGKLGSPEVVAYISMDINPSIEMGIDAKENVLELRGLNDDGTKLAQEVDYKGKSLEAVTSKLLDKAEQGPLANQEAEIVIASTVVEPKSQVSDAGIAEKLRKQVTKHIQEAHPTKVEAYQVAAFAAPQEVREVASQNGVSMGKYTVYLNAKSNGESVTLDELKRESVLQISKQKPEVAKLIQPDKLPTKADIKKMVEEEKNGELDKKLEEQLKDRKQDKDKNSKTGQNGKNGSKNDSKNDSKNNSSKNDSRTDSKNDPKNDSKKSGSTTGNSGKDKSKDDDKNDDKDSNKRGSAKDEKSADQGKTTPVNTRPGSTPPAGTKPGTTNPGTSRPGDKNDDKKEDDRKKDDDRKKRTIDKRATVRIRAPKIGKMIIKRKIPPKRTTSAGARMQTGVLTNLKRKSKSSRRSRTKRRNPTRRKRTTIPPKSREIRRKKKTTSRTIPERKRIIRTMTGRRIKILAFPYIALCSKKPLPMRSRRPGNGFLEFFSHLKKRIARR
ncbi:anti-sigma factor domain-containing protein [Paenibacillus ehimensis]|uniref:anti-sigma factor domain-containing protein n=1 Tax=Paenibacillus ehimensis TaxID=79264 RepID=UPI00068839D6|nr:anti-sigma factor domain-containing protein [Paenibacillus ehimensis]